MNISILSLFARLGIPTLLFLSFLFTVEKEESSSNPVEVDIRTQCLRKIATETLGDSTQNVIDLYNRYAELSDSMGFPNDWVWGRLHAAGHYKEINRLDSMVFIISSITHRIESDGIVLPDSTEALHYLMKGTLHLFGYGDFVTAGTYFECAWVAAPADHYLAIKAQSTWASILLALGDTEKGSILMDTVLEKAVKILPPNHEIVRSLWLQEGGRRLLSDEFEEAYEAYKKVILFGKGSNKRSLMQYAVALLGMENAAFRLGKFPEFKLLNDELFSLPLAQIQNEILLKGTAISHQATYYYHLGNPEKAKRRIEKAASLTKTSPLVDDTHLVMGEMLNNMGEPRKAINLIKKNIPLWNQYYGPFSSMTIRAYIYLAESYHFLGTDDSVAYYISQAEQLVQPNDYQFKMHLAHLKMNLYLGQDDLEKVEDLIPFYDLAIDTVQDQAMISMAHIYKGRYFYKQGAYEKSIEAFRNSWKVCTGLNQFKKVTHEDLTKIVNLNLTIEILMEMGENNHKLFQKHGDPIYLERSIDHMDQALHAGALGKAMHWELETPYFYEKTILPTYHKILKLTHQAYLMDCDQKWVERGIMFVERFKSQYIRQRLREKEGSKQAEIPTYILDNINRLKALISRDKTLLAHKDKGSLNEEERDMLNNQIFSWEDTLQLQIKKIEKEYPRYYDLKYKVDPLSVQEIQQRLRSKTSMISYTFEEEVMHAFYIDQDTMIWHRSPVSKEQILAAVKNVYLQVSDRKSSQSDSDYSLGEYIHAAHELYTYLLEPFEESMSKSNHLHIVPEDSLFMVSFDALVMNADFDSNSHYSSLDYTLKHWDFSRTYAASASLMENTLPRKHRFKWLGWDAFTPRWKDHLMNLDSTNERFLEFYQQDDLGEHNRLINKLGQRRGFHELRGKDATLRSFLARAREASALHLSIHGKANENSPDSSLLIFAPETDLSQENHLYAYEIPNIPLQANFAFIAACESSAGGFHWAEGLLSLARSFQLAGCPSLIANLWEAESPSTAYIAEKFYEELAKGKTKAQALNAGKRQYLIKYEGLSVESHPHKWATLVLIGETGIWKEGIESSSLIW